MSKERSRPWHNPTPLPGFQPVWVGQFDTFDDWVNHAKRALTGHTDEIGCEVKPICVDAKGRRCNVGFHFSRARDDGAFPVRYFITGVIVPIREIVHGFCDGTFEGSVPTLPETTNVEELIKALERGTL